MDGPNSDEEKLGVLELCSALNGDDSLLALNCLRKFTLTVRQERYQALFPKNDDDDSDDDFHDEELYGANDMEMDIDENDEDINEPNNKKQKIEEWKLDVKSYNVPFVGTKVSKGDTGTIVPNQWPTGFLLAYLRQSPHAIEFAGDTLIPPSGVLQKSLIRSGRKKLSTMLYRAYLEALSELLTSAIPKSTLKWMMQIKMERSMQSLLMDKYLQLEHNQNNNENQESIVNTEPIVAAIMKDRYHGILQSLTTQATINKGKHSHPSFGPLTSPIFHILTNLSYISIKTARQVARSLINLKDGTLSQTMKVSKSNPTDSTSSKFKQSKKTLSSRSSCLYLATALIQTGDAQTINIVISPGSKHQKTCAGIVYTVFRNSMSDRSTEKENMEDTELNHYLKSLGIFLATFQNTLLSSVENGASSKVFGGDVSNRLKADLLGGDVLNRLTRLAELAPPISSTNALSSILSKIDTYDDESFSSFQFSSVLARRLLFTLLSDLKTSPFLVYACLPIRAENTARNYLQKIVRSLITLVPTAPTYSLGVRSFILHCLKQTPELMPIYFNHLTSMSDPKPSFDCISYYCHISSYMKKGPSVMECLMKANATKKIDVITLKSRNAETLMASAIPKSLTKSILSKSIQHSNPLLITETLKVLINILQRSYNFILNLHEMKSSSKPSEKNEKELTEIVNNTITRFTDALFHRLPDVQSLLAVRSKFDCFSKKETNNELDQSSSANLIILMQVYEIIRLYKECLPNAFRSIKFEWTKLIPENERIFLSIHPVLQFRLLKTLQDLTNSCKFGFDDQDYLTDNIRFTSKSFVSILSIAKSSNIPKIQAIAREIASMIIVRHAQNKNMNIKTQDCLNYEASQWIDNASKEVFPDIAKVFDSTQRNLIQHTILAAQAWSKTFPNTSLPLLSFSPLLTNALLALSASSSRTPSKEFICYVRSVVMKTLLFQLDPLPLSTLIVHCFQSTNSDHNEEEIIINLLHPVIEYAHTVLELSFDKKDRKNKYCLHKSLTSVATLMDGTHAAIVRMARIACASDVSPQDKQSSQLELDGIINQTLNKEVNEYVTLSILHQCLHHIYLIDKDVQKSKENSIAMNLRFLIRVTFAKALEMPNTMVNLSALEAVFEIFGQSKSPDTGIILALGLCSPVCSNENMIKRSPAFQSCLSEISSFLSTNLSRLIKDNSDNKASIFSNKDFSILVLFYILTGKRIPSVYKNRVVEALLQRCSFVASGNYPAQIKHFFFSFLSELMVDSLFPFNSGEICSHDFTKSSMTSVLELWLAIIEESNDCTLEEFKLAQKLEYIMCCALTDSFSDGIGAHTIFSAARNTPAKIVELYFSSLVHKDNSRKSIDKNSNLLSALIQYDCLTFSLPLLDSLDGEFESLYVNYNELDDSLAMIIIQSRENNFIGDILRRSKYHGIKYRFCERTCNHLKDNLKLQTSCDETSIKKRCEAVAILLRDSFIVPAFKTKLILKFSDAIKSIIDKSIRKPHSEYEKLLLLTVTSIVSQIIEDTSYSKILRSLLLQRLCSLLPRSLKALQKRQSTSTSHKSGFHSSFILTCLFNTGLSWADGFDKRTILEASADLQKAVIACLKLGIMNDENGVSPVCLRFIQILITNLSDPDSVFLKIFDVSQIHMMIVTHSMFKVTLALQETEISSKEHIDNNTDAIEDFTLTGLIHFDIKNVKIELAQLLVCCVSLVNGGIETDDSIWKTLFSTYNAGVGELDCVLRRLFYLYEELMMKSQKENQRIFTDQIRWGALGHDQTPVINDIGQNWEWFLQSFSLDRVRSTISQFPIWESLTPSPDLEVEIWQAPDDDTYNDVVHNDDQDENTKSSDEEDDSESNNSTHSADETKENVLNNKQHKHDISHNCKRDLWRGKGSDDRYSPAFILPLILSILLAFYPTSGMEKAKVTSSHDSQTENMDMSIDRPNENADDVNYESDEQREAFVNICYRLSEKGAVALALASLSCIDPDLRHIAVATLGLFLKGVYSQEAHNVTAWKQRPQLQMILDSIQRGLVVRRERTKAKMDDDDNVNGDVSLSNVPRLPHVSSAFLAKASLIVSEPNNDMYGSINAFFLKLSENRGAYKDTGGLPAFISMFCSCNDRPDHAKKEKLWALSLLKDGVVDGYDYVTASRRHVPELLLTSYETVARRKANSSSYELESILEAIHVLIRNGGRIAYHHFIQNVGLMSWLKSFLTSTDMDTSLPSIAIRIQVLNIITEVINRSLSMEEDEANDYISFEAKFLIKSVVELVVDTVHSPVFKKEKESGMHALRSSFCDTIWALESAVKVAGNAELEYEMQGFAFSGIKFESVHNIFLMTWPQKEALAKVIGSLVSFPFSSNQEDAKYVKSTCTIILNTLKEMPVVTSKEFFIRTLKRVNAIFLKFNDNVLEDDNLIKLVLSLRCKCLSFEDGIDTWESIISKLIKK